MDNSKRISFYKAVSWRLLGTMTTWILAFAITGDYALSTKFSILEFGSKIALFYTHERFWVAIMASKSKLKQIYYSSRN